MFNEMSLNKILVFPQSKSILRSYCKNSGKYEIEIRLSSLYKKRTDTYASVRHSTQSSHAVPNTSERRDKNYATLYLFTIFCW